MGNTNNMTSNNKNPEEFPSKLILMIEDIDDEMIVKFKDNERSILIFDKKALIKLLINYFNYKNSENCYYDFTKNLYNYGFIKKTHAGDLEDETSHEIWVRTGHEFDAKFPPADGLKFNHAEFNHKKH